MFQQSPQSRSPNSANVGLFEHILFSTSDGGLSTTPSLHSSLFQPMLSRSGLSSVGQFVKHLSTSSMPSRRLVLMSTVLARVSAVLSDSGIAMAAAPP